MCIAEFLKINNHVTVDVVVVFVAMCCLILVLNTLHTLSLHTFKFATHSSLLLLALDLVLAILKETSVAELHQMPTLAHLLLESTQRRFDRFTVTKLHLDLDSQFSTAC